MFELISPISLASSDPILSLVSSTFEIFLGVDFGEVDLGLASVSHPPFLVSPHPGLLVVSTTLSVPHPDLFVLTALSAMHPPPVLLALGPH